MPAHKAAEHRGPPTSPCFQQGFLALALSPDQIADIRSRELLHWGHVMKLSEELGISGAAIIRAFHGYAEEPERAEISRWFAVATNPKCEDRARASLRRAGYDVYLPEMHIERQHRRTKKWQTRTLWLMPRYLFVQMPAGPADWFHLRACDGVKCVLGAPDATGEVVPFPIPSESVERLMAMQADLEFDDTRAAKIRRREIGKNKRETITMRFPVGSKVRAKDGPFASLGGHVTSITAKGEVEAIFSLFGRLTSVTFPSGQLEPVEKAA